MKNPRFCHQKVQTVIVGAFQKAGVAVPSQFRNRLLVHAAVQETGHKVMAERVQVVCLGETVLVVEFPQPLGKGIRVNGFAIAMLRPKHAVPARSGCPQ